MIELEERIRERFEEVAHYRSWREWISENDFQYRTLVDFLGEVDGISVLDVGCGKGAFSRRMVEAGAEVSGIDIAEKFVGIAQRNIPCGRFKAASATKIPFEDAQFDAVFSFEVLEHIPDTEKAVAEMVRVLKPGGKILIIDKNILGIHPKYYIPTSLYKRYMELRDRWMYPRGFPFREKWFLPSRILSLLRKYCSWTDMDYLVNGRDGRTKPLLRLMPFLSMDVAWKGIK